MKILEHGKKPGDLKYTTTCRECKTKFEFLQSEGTVVADQRDGDYIQINCPVCINVCTVALTLGI